MEGQKKERKSKSTRKSQKQEPPPQPEPPQQASTPPALDHSDEDILETKLVIVEPEGRVFWGLLSNGRRVGVFADTLEEAGEELNAIATSPAVGGLGIIVLRIE